MFTDEGDYSPDDLETVLVDLYHSLGEEHVLREVHEGTSGKPGSLLKQLILSIRYDFGLPMHHENDYSPRDRAAIEERRYNPYSWNQATAPAPEVAAPEEFSEAQSDDDQLPD
jgi:hypothetical protein